MLQSREAEEKTTEKREKPDRGVGESLRMRLSGNDGAALTGYTVPSRSWRERKSLLLWWSYGHSSRDVQTGAMSPSGLCQTKLSGASDGDGICCESNYVISTTRGGTRTLLVI